MINADPQELAKFSELAHLWWDPDSDFRPLHRINPLRLDWIDATARLAGKRVLDVGCGGGILSDAMARRGARVLGIDLATKPLRVAQLHALEAGTRDVEYREVAVETLAAEGPATFDVITCMEMLEHVPDPASVVSACARLAVPGGWLFFSTINRNPETELRSHKQEIRINQILFDDVGVTTHFAVGRDYRSPGLSIVSGLENIWPQIAERVHVKSREGSAFIKSARVDRRYPGILRHAG